MAVEFKLPELGENLLSGIVAKILVSKGEPVKKGQPLLELETDKAVLEVPSEISGVVEKIVIGEGDEVKVGQTILLIGEEETEAVPKKQAAPPVTEKAEAVSPPPVEPEEEPSRAEAMLFEMKLPELGENIKTGTVAKVLLAPGDRVEAGQGVLELETDKAVLEVPAEKSGVVKQIFVSEGEQAEVGQVIAVLRVSEKMPVETTGKPSPPEPRLMAESVPDKVETAMVTTAGGSFLSGKDAAPAAPSVRRFAREIGIDINQVPGTGPSGRISVDDVKRFAKTLNAQRRQAGPLFPGMSAEPLPDFTQWGEVERQPMNSVRKKTAKHLSYAWASIPHVTQFDKADITELEIMRKQFSSKAETAGGKLTVTAILVKIVAAALKRFPRFNCSIDMKNEEIIYKKYIHIGVAVDTERGLLVPVVKNADRKNIIEISIEISQLAEKARNKKLTLEEMQGGNFSISNLGGIGGTGFTPVVNSPEVAILGVSRSQIEAVYREGKFEPRLMLPLSLSYDHRIIDGADAARFLRWVAEAIEQPFLLSLEG